MLEKIRLFFSNKPVYDALQKSLKGDVNSMVILADAYYYGEGVELNLEKAYAWYQKAAEQSNPKALCLLGYMKRNGIGCEKDHVGAFDAFKKSAGLGYPMAMYNLGICFEEGIGTDPDKGISESWYGKAKALGYTE